MEAKFAVAVAVRTLSTLQWDFEGRVNHRPGAHAKDAEVVGFRLCFQVFEVSTSAANCLFSGNLGREVGAPRLAREVGNCVATTSRSGQGVDVHVHQEVDVNLATGFFVHRANFVCKANYDVAGMFPRGKR